MVQIYEQRELVSGGLGSSGNVTKGEARHSELDKDKEGCSADLSKLSTTLGTVCKHQSAAIRCATVAKVLIASTTQRSFASDGLMQTRVGFAQILNETPQHKKEQGKEAFQQPL